MRAFEYEGASSLEEALRRGRKPLGSGTDPLACARGRSASGRTGGGEDSFEHVARVALQAARPLRHNGYKVPLTRALLKRALRTLAG